MESMPIVTVQSLKAAVRSGGEIPARYVYMPFECISVLSGLEILIGPDFHAFVTYMKIAGVLVLMAEQSIRENNILFIPLRVKCSFYRWLF